MNPTARCDPSQNGLRADRPHRHNATVRRPQSIGSPSGPTISNEPRTINGPSSYGLIDAPAGNSFIHNEFPSPGSVTLMALASAMSVVPTEEFFCAGGGEAHGWVHVTDMGILAGARGTQHPVGAASAVTARNAVGRIEADQRLDAAAAILTRAAQPLLDRRSLASILRGEFMGHALHPLLTDVPIGAWLSAAVLDLAGGDQARAAATRLTGAGLLAAVPTVASGLVELVSTGPADRRVGATHAMFNTAAAGCYLISYVQRKRGQHRRGVAMGLAAAALLGVGGYLGGHLAVVRKVGTIAPGWRDSD